MIQLSCADLKPLEIAGILPAQTMKCLLTLYRHGEEWLRIHRGCNSTYRVGVLDWEMVEQLLEEG